MVTDNARNMIKAINVLFHDGDGDNSRIDDSSDPTLWEDIDGDEVDMAMRNMGSRLSCFAYSLQLVVPDGLATLGVVRFAMAKCSKLANTVHQSIFSICFRK